MNKTGLMILLLLSAVLVLYPQISTLIDALNQLANYSSLPQEIVKIRDNAIMQVTGTCILYVFLYLFLNSRFERQSTQQINPSTSIDNSPAQQTKQTPPVSKKVITWICVVSILAFLGTFFWQFIPSGTTGGFTSLGAALASLPLSIIATCIVAVGLYLLFKHVVEVE